MVFTKGHKPWNTGKQLSEDHKEKMRRAKDTQRKLIRIRDDKKCQK